MWAYILSFVTVTALSLVAMGVFSSKNHFPVNGKTVLITGGSQGMGRSVGRLLAQKGANVIVVARNVQQLRDAIEHISAGAANPSTQRFHHISADLTSPDEASRVLQETTAWNAGKPPDTVWCIAGFARPTLFVDTPPEVLKEQLDTNYLSSAYIAHAALNLWLNPPPSDPKAEPPPPPPSAKSKPPLPEPRHLIFTSSVVAFYPLAGYAAYAPSKANLRTLTDLLSQELLLYAPSPTRPAVVPHCVFPATIFSPGLEEENKQKHPVTHMLEEGDKGQSAEEVARASVRGLEKGQEMVSTEVLGALMKRGMLGSSRGRGVWDIVLGAVVNVVFGVVRWDMDGKVRRYGREKMPS